MRKLISLPFQVNAPIIIRSEQDCLTTFERLYSHEHLTSESNKRRGLKLCYPYTIEIACKQTRPSLDELKKMHHVYEKEWNEWSTLTLIKGRETKVCSAGEMLSERQWEDGKYMIGFISTLETNASAHVVFFSLNNKDKFKGEILDSNVNTPVLFKTSKFLKTWLFGLELHYGAEPNIKCYSSFS